ncbi:ataxin-2 isoform X9 [Engraulis encrasicolus]|uniref:ataxin-2 isoform X9 n=1 Tax=Engraulis encrasicolus TaxID=184585 RepID=UPI002FD3C2A2
MSMKQAGGNRKPGGSGSSAAAASGAGGGGGAGGRQSLGRGRNGSKGVPTATPFNGVYANMRMVHILTSVVGTKCELTVRNGINYEGIFKTYGPECDLVLDAAHRSPRSPEPATGPRREDIVESIIFKSSDVVVVQFKDVDLNFAKKVPTEADNFTDTAVSGTRVNGEHKEKDLEPWDGGAGEQANAAGSLESLDTDLSNGWDPDDMFKYNEETYGVKSTYDSSLSSYTVPLERDSSEEFLKREQRAAQLADEIESSSTYKARVALENDERTEEDKFTAVVRGGGGAGGGGGGGGGGGEREGHTLNRENKYIPPGQRNMSWGSGRQNSPRLAQCSPGPHTPRSAPHDYSSPPGMDQRVVNGGPPRMSPKSQRTPRTHRVPSSRSGDFLSHNAPGEAATPPPPARSSPSGGTWSSVVSGAHRPRSPRQSNLGGASPGPASVVSSPQTGTAPVDSVANPMSAGSPIAASPASNTAATPSAEAKEPRVQEARQNSPTANKENVKPIESTTGATRTLSKGPPSMAPDHRKQNIDNLKKFSVDFRLQSSSNPDPVFDPKAGEKPKDLPLDGSSGKGPADAAKADPSTNPGSRDDTSSSASATTPVTMAATPNKPVAPSPSPSPSEQKRSPDMTSQGVQTSTPGGGAGGPKADDKDEKKDPVLENVRKSTLNPNAKEFNPRAFSTPPKPATPTLPPRPQGQPSPSIVVQQPPAVYGQPVCFPQMYPLTPVSPGVQKSIIWKPPAMYHVQMPHMTVSQNKPYRPGKVPNMPQQRPEQHHQQGSSAMMHAATAAGPPIVAPSPAYSTQYFTCSPQQFASQQLVQQMPHYQSQAQHVFSPVMQGNPRMMTPPQPGQPTLVSSSANQYGEQTHTMYVSMAPQQYAHPNATLHPHPQPSATPTGQGQQVPGGHQGGNHPAPSPVQHPQHPQGPPQAALHLGNQPQQQQMYSALAPTPPSMTPGPNPQSPQASFPSAPQAQAVYLHPQQMQHGYNPSHMAHMQQAHMQSGMVASHHATSSHPPMMLMATQPPGGPQPQMPQSALNPIPVSSTTHFSYMAHAPVQPHHQQQL